MAFPAQHSRSLFQFCRTSGLGAASVVRLDAKAESRSQTGLHVISLLTSHRGPGSLHGHPISISLVVLLVDFVSICEVARFPFDLLLLCSHPIQLRSVKHDLDCVVPAEIVVIIKD